jgi:hypothetical protein
VELKQKEQASMSRAVFIVLLILSLLSFAQAQSPDQTAVAKRVYNGAYRAREASYLTRSASIVISELNGAVVTVSGTDNDVLVITKTNFSQQTASHLFSNFDGQSIGEQYFRIGFTTVRITNGQQTWEATPTAGGFSRTEDRLNGTEVSPEDCCATYMQEKQYCKAWAAGIGHAKISYSHGWYGSSGYCPNFLIKQYDEAVRQGGSDTGGITLEERQAAEAAIARDNAKAAAENFLNAHRCGGLDPRPVSERDADVRLWNSRKHNKDRRNTNKP